ncbi:uncharacterized protein LOC110847259 [Folsomia candida]|nr:uncharacterized protein LOC110847259 [Folsomia candida]
MSGTVCCYKGCTKSYSTDKDVSFFRFPDDQKRRKKWMDNCGIAELHSLNDRQLRLKRVCADHFASSSFICPVTRNQVTEKAIPLSQKEHEAAAKAVKEAQKEEEKNPRRGRGRPPKFSLVLVKKEVVDEEEDVDSDEEEPNENGDVEYSPPPTLRKQTRDSNSTTTAEPKTKTPAKPPKLIAVESSKQKAAKVLDGKLKPVSTLLPAKSKLARTDSSDTKKPGGRRMADLSVIEDVVKEMSLGIEKSKKRHSLSDEKILSKRLKASSFNEDDINSEDDMSDIDDSEDEEDEGLERANREFEMFQSGLRKIIELPEAWGMGAVVWDPLNKMKVIPISRPKLQPNGTISLFRAIQIYEDSSVKVAIDGVDMTINFKVKSIDCEGDVNKIIKAVADSRVCTGVENFLPDDIIYLPDARKRGYKYYSDACPVVIDENVKGSVCNPCIGLQKAVLARKEKEKDEVATRKLRPVPKNLKNDFGRALYGLLYEILDDSNALKSEKKQDREAVLSKYSTELGVLNGEIQKPEKLPHVQVSVDDVSASFQDIVTRLGFSLNKKPGPGGAPIVPTQPQAPKPPVARLDDNRSLFASKPFLNRFNRNIPAKPSTTTFTQRTMVPMGSSASASMSNSTTSFSLGDGQTYEILGEVGSSEMVQGTKGEAIEIIEVDDETMAKLTAQNSGMMFQNSASGSIQVATLDPSDPNISQILKAINPSQA